MVTNREPCMCGDTECTWCGTYQGTRNERIMDRGPWTVEHEGRHLYSADFEHDVCLEITGDFAGDAGRIEYAEWLAEVLNAAAKVAER